MKVRISVVSILSVVLGLAGETRAQVDVTTGRIVGAVVDADGQALPGATITATSEGTGWIRTGLTDARGTYRIVSIPVGTYSVTASLPGFGSQSEPRVVVTLGSAPTVDFKLRLAPRSADITITGELAPIETTQTASQTTIDNNAIRSLPINGRNFTDFVLLAPSAQRDPAHGNIQLAGQRGINTSVTLDGVDYNDAFFGGSSGDGSAEGRAPFTLSQESVRELQVIENGASVEFGRSGGGFVNVVTKSGGNDFHGSAFTYNRPQSLTARFADGTEPKDQQTQQFGASIGGPVLRDRLFFFGAWDQQKQSTTIPITSSLVTDPDIAARYPKFGQTDTSYVQEQNGRVFFGRLDLQLGNRHRIYARANTATYDGLNGTSSSQTQSTSHNGIEGLTSGSYVASWNALFSKGIINDLNFQYARNDVPREDKGLGLPEIRLGSAKAPFATLGENYSLPILTTDRRTSIGDTGTVLAGPHVIKVGAEYNDTGADQLSKSAWRGIFFFNYPTPDLAKAAFLAGRWTDYIEFLGLNGHTVDQAGATSEGQRELAFFVQDQWFVSPSLTVTLGVRYERLDNPDDAVLDVKKLLVPGARDVQPDVQIPDENDQWSPRLSVAWSPGKSGKSVVRLSLGRYFSRTPETLFSQLYPNNGLVGATYSVTVGALGPAPGVPAPGWGAAFNPNAVQQVGSLPPGTSVGALGVFTVAPDFRNPHTDRVSLGAERELFGVVWGLEGIWAKGYDLERLNDPNLVASPAANCPLLDPNSGSACYGVSPNSFSQNRINPNYDRVTVYTSDARSDYKAATLYFRRNYAAGFRFFGSLTRASDYDTDANERNSLGFTLWDTNNPELNWAPSDRDIKWRGVANASYERRFGRVDAFAAVLFDYQTGRPYNAYTSVDANKDGIATDRATIDGVVVGRNAFRQPDSYTVDVRLGLGFRLGPGTLAMFLDVFNLTNTGNRSTTLTTYPSSGSAAFGTLNAFTTTPRTLQISGRFDF